MVNCKSGYTKVSYVRNGKRVTYCRKNKRKTSRRKTSRKTSRRKTSRRKTSRKTSRRRTSVIYVREQPQTVYVNCRSAQKGPLLRRGSPGVNCNLFRGRAACQSSPNCTWDGRECH